MEKHGGRILLSTPVLPRSSSTVLVAVQCVVYHHPRSYSRGGGQKNRPPRFFKILFLVLIVRDRGWTSVKRTTVVKRRAGGVAVFTSSSLRLRRPRPSWRLRAPVPIGRAPRHPRAWAILDLGGRGGCVGCRLKFKQSATPHPTTATPQNGGRDQPHHQP